MRIACLVLDFLAHWERHLLCEDVAYPVQFHRLTPIVECARHKHFARVVRPRFKCGGPSGQRCNPCQWSLCHRKKGTGAIDSSVVAGSRGVLP